MLGFQLADACGQGVELTLLLETELADFGGRSRRTRRGGQGGQRVGGLLLFGLLVSPVVEGLGPFLSPALGNLVGAFGLHQPVGHAAFVFAPLGVALISNGAGDHVVQKGAVMADQEHGAVVALQQVFEQLQRVDVQVIGRLVEHQHVGWARKQARQQQAVALATGE